MTKTSDGRRLHEKATHPCLCKPCQTVRRYISLIELFLIKLTIEFRRKEENEDEPKQNYEEFDIVESDGPSMTTR